MRSTSETGGSGRMSNAPMGNGLISWTKSTSGSSLVRLVRFCYMVSRSPRRQSRKGNPGIRSASCTGSGIHQQVIIPLAISCELSYWIVAFPRRISCNSRGYFYTHTKYDSVCTITESFAWFSLEWVFTRHKEGFCRVRTSQWRRFMVNGVSGAILNSQKNHNTESAISPIPGLHHTG